MLKQECINKDYTKILIKTIYETLWTIQYYLYILKNVKNTNGEVLQKVTLPMDVFYVF